MNKKLHDIAIINIDIKYLFILIDGIQYKIPWNKCSMNLKNASQFERGEIKIAPSGYGLHWPAIDEDLAIEPLLKSAIIIKEKIRLQST